MIAIVLFLFELTRFRFHSLDQRSIRVFLNSLLIIFTAVTYFSGFFGRDVATLSPSHADIIATHEGFARLALILCCCQGMFLLMREAALGKPGQSVRVVAALYLCSVITLTSLLIYTALLGGGLVFGHGLGVKLR